MYWRPTDVFLPIGVERKYSGALQTLSYQSDFRRNMTVPYRNESLCFRQSAYGENMSVPYKRHFSGISGQLAKEPYTVVCTVLNEKNKSTARTVL